MIIGEGSKKGQGEKEIERLQDIKTRRQTVRHVVLLEHAHRANYRDFYK